MNRIDAVFAESRRVGRKVFIPFVTAGDPDLAVTEELVVSIARLSETTSVPMIVEIGFPYSDPIADGSTIQASYTRALRNGIRVQSIFETLERVRQRAPNLPLVAMVSYSLVFRQKSETFFDRAVTIGLDGVIIPDLPVEESETVATQLQSRDLKLIQLIAPTTPDNRANSIVGNCSGFVYCVSVTGITGSRVELPRNLSERIDAVRKITSLPVCVGFGISTPEQVASVARSADGVIVGSAIVRQLENVSRDDSGSINSVVRFVGSLMQPLAVN